MADLSVGLVGSRAFGGSDDAAWHMLVLTSDGSDDARFYLDGNYATMTGAPMATFIDPKTLKKCKHRWEPLFAAHKTGWTVDARCRRCREMGTPDDVSLGKLLGKLLKRHG